MNYTMTEIWIIILALGVGTFVIRFSFLGILGNRALPLWPEATGGQMDPSRIAAASLALAVGLWTKKAIWAIVVGMAILWGIGWLLH